MQYWQIWNQIIFYFQQLLILRISFLNLWYNLSVFSYRDNGLRPLLPHAMRIPMASAGKNKCCLPPGCIVQHAKISVSDFKQMQCCRVLKKFLADTIRIQIINPQIQKCGLWSVKCSLVNRWLTNNRVRIKKTEFYVIQNWKSFSDNFS